MDNPEQNEPVSLDNKDFKRLSEFIMSQYGIKMPPIKKVMLQGRLHKRLVALNLKSYKDYIDYLFSPTGQKDELSHMIDSVSTNKTDFFREQAHFDFLYAHGIETYLSKTGKRRLTIWSAGCSSGEEPYSIAMTLNEFCLNKLLIDFHIVATDISTGILENAVVGIYHTDKVSMFPMDFKKKYLLKGKDNYENKVRVIPAIRNKVAFQKFNLVTSNFSALGEFDIIFCRNVMIYFERDVQYKILRQFAQQLNPEGYLFIGHSESLTGFELPFRSIKPTIYYKV